MQTETCTGCGYRGSMSLYRGAAGSFCFGCGVKALKIEDYEAQLAEALAERDRFAHETSKLRSSIGKQKETIRGEQRRAEKAEARCRELEKELAEARAQSDARAEAARLRGALEDVLKRTEGVPAAWPNARYVARLVDVDAITRAALNPEASQAREAKEEE